MLDVPILSGPLAPRAVFCFGGTGVPPVLPNSGPPCRDCGPPQAGSLAEASDRQ
jgi:hypothetical protein